MSGGTAYSNYSTPCNAASELSRERRRARAEGTRERDPAWVMMTTGGSFVGGGVVVGASERGGLTMLIEGSGTDMVVK